jgi:hypothetical protein
MRGLKEKVAESRLGAINLTRKSLLREGKGLSRAY